MPRRVYRRRTRRVRRSRGGNALSLALAALLLVLLLLVVNGRGIDLPLPRVDLPNITIPITGLPRVEIPQTGIKIPITVVPGDLPDVQIGGTLVPDDQPAIGVQSQTSGCQLNGSRPDPECTPGHVLTTDTQQVCQPGYSDEVRDVDQSQKDAIYAAYGVTNPGADQYQVDHLIPLSLGGSNADANLWPQPASPRPGYAEKDALERYLRTEVCEGRMTIQDAQRQFANDWVGAYQAMP